MGIVASLTGIFNSERAGQIALLKKIKGLPKEERDAELGVFLHDLCVRYASEFVKEELARGDSPFRGLKEYPFFHEVMLVNLWIMEKVISDKKKALIEEVHRKYLKSFHFSGEREQEVRDSLARRCKTYNASWDEYSGHHDVFGEKFTEFMFGSDAKVPVAQTSFWIISYTNSTMKSMLKVQKLCHSAGIKI